MWSDFLKIGLGLINLAIDSWRTHSDNEQAQIGQAIAEATVQLTKLAASEPLGLGKSFEIRARGVVAIELARVGIDADHPPIAVSIARDAAVYAARAAYEKRTP